MDWMERLAAELERAERCVVLGVGNADRGDDAAGPAVVRRLLARLRESPRPGVLAIDGGAVPENETGPIRRFAPDLVLIIDAAVGRLRPGTIFLPAPDEIADDTVSTHKISLRHLVRYLEEDIGSRVLVVGIQPRTLEEGDPMSEAARLAVNRLAGELEARLVETDRRKTPRARRPG